MSSLNDPVNILVRRFVSLPAHVRIEISGRLLRWREENQAARDARGRADRCGERKKSFLEQFWDEVETAHGDDLYPANPFAESRAWQLPDAMKQRPEQCLAY